MTSAQCAMNLYVLLGMDKCEPSLPKTVYNLWCTKIVTITEFPPPRFYRQRDAWVLDACWYPEFEGEGSISRKTYFAESAFFDKSTVSGFLVAGIANWWTTEDAYNMIAKMFNPTHTDKIKEQA